MLYPKMPNNKFNCFSFTASRNRCLMSAFSSWGLRPVSTDLGDGTAMRCYVPKTRNPTRPDMVLIHGFGANSLWQFCDTAKTLAPHFNVYIPDLVFFGESYSTRPERTDSFQALCVKRAVEANGVEKISVVLGLSYGGFVAYSMAAQCVERVVICCAGVCLEEKDLKEGLFPVANVEEGAEVLLPQTAEKMRELIRYTFVKPPKGLMMSCLLNDFIQEMCMQHVEEKKELLRAIAKDRKLSDLPRISQARRRYAELVVLKNTGHAFINEKPKEFHNHLKAFLFNQLPSNSKTPNANPENHI